MLYANLFDKIEFTDEMKSEYKRYKAMVSDEIDSLAYSYVHKNVPILRMLLIGQREQLPLKKDTKDL